MKSTKLLVASSFVVFAACGQVKIEAAPIGEVDFTGAKFAFFASTSEAVDADADGTVDDQSSSLVVVMSNDSELCTKITADPNSLDAEADARVVSLATSKIDIDGTAGIAEGDVLTNVALLDPNGAFVDGSILGLSFSQLVNGEAAVQAVNDLTSASDTVTLSKFDLEAGDLSLELSATLTDATIAGAASEISEAVTISIKSAEQCDALLTLE